MSSTSSHDYDELPAVDERLIDPNTRFEIDDGQLIYVPPADERHGSLHSKLSALLEAHVASDFNAASDMLTRTSRVDDIAPDASVYPRARDPQTGRRQLEQLAFEIVSTQTLNNCGNKAAKLCGRGVRRVFAIDVINERVFEWSVDFGIWTLVDPGSSIKDPTLAVALPIIALVDAASADDAVARALLAKDNPVLVEAVSNAFAEGQAQGHAQGHAKGHAQGHARGQAEAILGVLTARNVNATPDERERILGERDLATLNGWVRRAGTCTTVDELFD